MNDWARRYRERAEQRRQKYRRRRQRRAEARAAEGTHADGQNDAAPLLSPEQWERIAPLLPGPRRRGRCPDTDLQSVVRAILYRWQTGCAWRDLPDVFPPWSTVYTYFRDWQRSGVLGRLCQALGVRPTEGGAAW